MNFFVPDSLLGRQRCRQWTPLLTQQLRLRHLHQIVAYNVTSRTAGSFYYTLHLTTMCAPFYTSKKTDSCNPKWSELDTASLPYSSMSAFVLRIWQSASDNDVDVVITTWGINLSGLVYLGVKLSDIQPEYFNENSVIFNMRGGFFTSYNLLRLDMQKPFPFIDNLNIVSTELDTKVYRNSVLQCARGEVKGSYTVSQLQKLHSSQVAIKNQSLDVQVLRDKIAAKCGLCNNDTLADLSTEVSPPIHRHPSQLLTMTTLNKMLKGQTKLTKLQRQQVTKIEKQIELVKFRTKLLAHEKDKKSARIRQLKQKCTMLMDENEERGSQLMENYRKLSRDVEKFTEWRKEQSQLKEVLSHLYTQLHHRKHQLMNELLEIYPIQVSARKCLINGIYLPDSEMLSDCADGSLAVALGYVSHVLLMCAQFLQVPLRYPITFFGSRSLISDHITASLSEKDRDFPLYAKGKDRMQFNYAVYLLNKNIAQMRWLCGQHTPDLRATLPNLYSLLQGHEYKESRASRPVTIPPCKLGQVRESFCSELASQHHPQRNLDFISHLEGASNMADPILDTLRHEFQMARSHSPTGGKGRKARTSKLSERRPGLGEILAIPEAFMGLQMTHADFKNYATTEKFKQLNLMEGSNSETKSTQSFETAISHSSQEIASSAHLELYSKRFDSDLIEQGTDILDSSLHVKDDAVDSSLATLLKQTSRISRSEGSIIGGDLRNDSLELGSDPLINVSSETECGKGATLESFSSNLDGQQEFLQKWLENGPALVCSEENLYPDEILGSTASVVTESPLTLRTDALLNTSSFNLIKPK